MKIAGTGPVQTTPIRRRTGAGKSSGSGFADQLSTTASPSGASAPAQTGPMDGLLLLQEVDDESGQRRQAKERGEALLDRLDEIRSALLRGTMDGGSLDQLLNQVREQKVALSDPRLREVLDEIELRVAVELAKFGRSA